MGLDRFSPGVGKRRPRRRGKKRRWRILAATLSPTPIRLELRDTEKGKGVSSPFLPSSLSSALAMAEAGAGLSETVTETTVTVTTEPVRKAGEGGRRYGEGGDRAVGRVGSDTWAGTVARHWGFGQWQRCCRRVGRRHVTES